VRNDNRRNFYFAAAESYIEVVIGLVSTVVLARILTPAEIGTFSVAASFVGLAHAFRELGVGHYLIQEKDLTHERIRAAFAVSLLAAWPVGSALLLASPYLGRFYSNPDLTPILVVLAANFFLLPFGSVTLALLRRSMLFGRGLIINISGSIFRVAASISLALAGLGALSLALGATAGLIVTIILAAAFHPRGLPWLPGTRQIRHVLKFGLTVTGGSLAASANESAPDLVLGKVLGAFETGIFNKALGLATMINNIIMQPLWKFVMPYFSQKIRSGEDIRPAYLSIVSLVTGFMWPALLTAAIAADPIVRTLLGEQWVEAIPAARILCLAMAIRAAFAPLTSLLISQSRADLYLRVAMVGFFFRCSFLLGTVWFGLSAVAWGFLGAAFANGAYDAQLLRRNMSIGLRDVLYACKNSFVLSLVVVPFSAVATLMAAGWAPPISLLAVALASVGSWLSAISSIHPMVADEVFHSISRLTGRRRVSRS